MFWFRKDSAKELDFKLPFEQIRKLARIVVIDDNEAAFPYTLLQKEGYNIVYWPRIERLKDLEEGEYDLIILDIAGVADKALSSTDGAGVLTHLKRRNPAQLIIAYSGQKYDLSKAGFYNEADDFLGKPSDLITCKEKIDLLLQNHFTPQRYWDEVQKILNKSGISPKELKKLESKILSTLRKGDNFSLEKIKTYASLSADSLTVLSVLFQIIKRFFNI